MTTAVNDTLDRYTISGAGPYAFSFRIFDSSDLSVTALEDGDVDPVSLTLNTHYTVTGVNSVSGGSITLIGGADTTYDDFTLDIRSNIPLAQPTSIKNQGSFLPGIHETAFDRLNRQVQDLARQMRQSFRYPDNVDLDAKMTSRSAWLERFTYVNADGEIEPAAGVTDVALTQSVIGEITNPRTDAERDALVTPVNYAIPSHDVTGLVDPRRYGAVSGGTAATNQTAFANAVLVFAQSGCPLWVAPTVSGFQVTTGGFNASAKGAGYKSYVYTSTADANVFALSSLTGAAIESLRIRANGSSTGDNVGCGIFHTSCNDLTIFGCWIENARNGINGVNANRVTISKNNIQDTVGQYGVLHIGSDDVVIDGNNFEGTSAMAEAIQFNVNSGTRNRRCVVSNNTIDLSNANTAGPVGISMRYVDGGAVFGNTIESDTAVNDGAAGVFSIIVNHSTGIAVTGNYCKGGVAPNPSTIAVGINVGDDSHQIIVANNVIENATVGIYFNVASGVCSGNYINGTQDGPGIIASLGVLADADVVINGNVVDGTTGSTAYGIRIDLMRGVICSSNIVRGGDSLGIYVTDCENTTIALNHVFGCDGDGIQVSNSIRSTVEGNKCYDNNTDGTAGGAGIQIVGASSDRCIIKGNACGNVGGTGDQKYGIHISTAGATGCTLEGNDVRSNTTAGILDASSDARIRNNQGYVSENGGTSAGITSGGTIAHGLAGTPTVFSAVPTASATDVVVTADAANLTVTFGGGGTVAFAWEAKLASHYA